jgi:hypothetical protein
VNQGDHATEQQDPSEDQHGCERSDNVAYNTGCARKDKENAKSQEPTPGAANLGDTRRE